MTLGKLHVFFGFIRKFETLLDHQIFRSPLRKEKKKETVLTGAHYQSTDNIRYVLSADQGQESHQVVFDPVETYPVAQSVLNVERF